MIAYASYLLQVMVQRQSLFFTTSTIVTDLIKSHEDHHPAQHGFAVGLGFRFSNVSMLDEEMLRYYSIKFQQKVRNHDASGNYEDDLTELEVSNCDSEYFPYHDQDLVTRYSINNYV
jgi:hypothetical protein